VATSCPDSPHVCPYPIVTDDEAGITAHSMLNAISVATIDLLKANPPRNSAIHLEARYICFCRQTRLLTAPGGGKHEPPRSARAPEEAVREERGTGGRRLPPVPQACLSVRGSVMHLSGVPAGSSAYVLGQSASSTEAKLASHRASPMGKATGVGSIVFGLIMIFLGIGAYFS